MGLESVFLDFSATKKIKIRDPVLGISNRLIQLACLIYAIVDFTNGGMLYFETPRGHAQFWANQADLQVEQAVSPAYCTGIERNYGDRFCQQERDAGFGIFCEFDVACRAFAFSEMNIKGENQMFFMTINKDVEVNYGEGGATFKTACADKTTGKTLTGYATGQLPATRYAAPDVALDLEGDYIYSASTTGQATCTKMVNEYATGVEGMTMAFGHSYWIDSKPEMFHEDVREGVKVHTFLHRKGDVIDPSDPDYEERSCMVEGKKVSPCEFDEGSGVELSIVEWLKLAGLGEKGLDEINEAGMKGRPPFSAAELSYRTSGVAIDLDMKWMGGWSKGETVELHIFVDAQGGWHSKGSEVHYSKYPVSNANGVFTTGTYHDRYKRGINFKFGYGGVVDTFDGAIFVVKMTSLTVLLSLSETIVVAVAVSLLGYKSKVYTKTLEQPVSINSLHAKIASQALIATAAYQSINTNDGKGGTVTRDDVMLAFTQLGISQNDAEKLAAHILEHAGVDENGNLTFENFSNLFGTDETTLSAVIKHIPEALESGVQMLGPGGGEPPPLEQQNSTRGMNMAGLFGQSGPKQYDIQVPPGARAGSLITFTTVDGRPVSVRVPPNATPGTTLRVSA
jgi:hypothetical protein